MAFAPFLKVYIWESTCLFVSVCARIIYSWIKWVLFCLVSYCVFCCVCVNLIATATVSLLSIVFVRAEAAIPKQEVFWFSNWKVVHIKSGRKSFAFSFIAMLFFALLLNCSMWISVNVTESLFEHFNANETNGLTHSTCNAKWNAFYIRKLHTCPAHAYSWIMMSFDTKIIRGISQNMHFNSSVEMNVVVISGHMREVFMIGLVN